MDCAVSFVKLMLFIFNFFFVLSGIAMITVGSIIHSNSGSYSEFLDAKFSTPPITLIVIGCIVLVISFFGCCGAIKESRCMIMTFAILLLVIFVLELTIGILAIVYKDKVEKSIMDSMYVVQRDYGNSEDAKKTFNALQHDLKCCGVKGPDDWLTTFTNFPSSCCEKDLTNQTCNRLSTDNKVYEIGCWAALKMALDEFGVALGAVAITVAFVEIIGVTFACCLANSIKNEGRRGRYK